MLKPLLAAALLTLAAAPAFAQDARPVLVANPAQLPAGAYTLDKTHASLTFKVSHMGMSQYTARFAELDGTLDLNPADATKSKVSVTVNPASITTDYPNAKKTDFDAELAQGANWFNAGKFPEIRFVSTRLEKLTDTTGKMTGDLTFLGVTRPLTLDVKFNGGYEKMPMLNLPALGFSATGKLRRSDWGMTTYMPMVGDEVSLLIETEFHKVQQ